MGTIAELQGKPDRLYPLLWLSNEGGSLEDNYKVDNIRLTMFGRVIAGEEGQDDDASEIEVLSDMQLILLDFLNHFHQNHGQEYVTDKFATLEHFTERTNDRTAGYSCVLELKQFYDWNKCQIPQSGASIPPTVDGLTLYDFCDQSVIDRLTAAQVTCLQAEFSGSCDPATLTVNGAAFTTVASGGSLDIEVHDTAGNNVGTVASATEIGISDSRIEINGSVSDAVTAEATYNQQIHDSAGSDVGTVANPSVITDNTINFNGSNVDTVKAQETYTFTVELDAVQAGTYDAGTNKVSVTSVPPSLAVAISDATPNVGDAVNIVATPTGITPTSYTFYTPIPNGGFIRTNQAGDTLAWRVAVKGSYTVYVTATDGSNEVSGNDAFTSSWLGFDDAAVLNGSTQYFQTDVNDFQSVFSGNKFYINMWFRADSLANIPVLFASTDSQEFIEIAASNVYVRWGNSLRTYTSVALTTGTWYMLTVVKHHDGNNLCVFIDGVMLTSFTGAVADHNAAAKGIIIGKFTSGAFNFDGKIDEFSIKAGCTPSTAQILAAYNSGTGDAVTAFGTYPDMWTPYNGDGLDYSGNGYHTTAYNGVTYAAH